MITRAALFYAGLLVIFLALVSPIHALSEQLFSAHMLQHVLLMHIAAPLLALSSPLPALLFTLPARARHSIGKWWGRGGWLPRLWRQIDRPVTAWCMYALTLWGWHIPALYSAALENDTIHALEHLSFLFAALLFWWQLFHHFAPFARLRGYGLLYLFLAILQSGILGALITYSPVVWYPVYQGSALLASLTPLADQQIAGLIMWAADGLVFIPAMLWLAERWRHGLLKTNAAPK